MHGSYSVTRGQILRVGVPKGPKYFRSMTEGELNDRNNIFLPMYYALFFLGTSITLLNSKASNLACHLPICLNFSNI